jgi:hypothetical protein
MPIIFARKPREPVLTLNKVKGKDGMVGVRVFGGVQFVTP